VSLLSHFIKNASKKPTEEVLTLLELRELNLIPRPEPGVGCGGGKQNSSPFFTPK
jgi:hypothetical protein